MWKKETILDKLRFSVPTALFNSISFCELTNYNCKSYVTKSLLKYDAIVTLVFSIKVFGNTAGYVKEIDEKHIFHLR